MWQKKLRDKQCMSEFCHSGKATVLVPQIQCNKATRVSFCNSALAGVYHPLNDGWQEQFFSKVLGFPII